MIHAFRRNTKYLALIAAVTAVGAAGPAYSQILSEKDVSVKMFAPAKGDNVGIGGRGWFIDLAIEFDGGLAASGFTDFQLTGPAGHNNIAPFPGVFAPGRDDRLPGVVVLVSTSAVGAGSCQNVANLFNLTGVTNQSSESVEIWDTWLVGAPLFGVDTDSIAFAAVVADLNGDGIYNDAPDVVADANGDGMCNGRDLRKLGVASNVARVPFHIAK